MKEKEQKYKVSDLSQHLFWDVNRDKIEWEESKKLIIERVLEYGIKKDWDIIKEVYPKRILKEVTLNLPYLTPKTLNFISIYLDTPKELFRCYKQRPLNQEHWIY